MQNTAIPVWMIELKNEIERVGYGEILLIVRQGKPTKFKTTVYKDVTHEPKEATA